MDLRSCGRFGLGFVGHLGFLEVVGSKSSFNGHDETQESVVCYLIAQRSKRNPSKSVFPWSPSAKICLENILRKETIGRS